MAVVFSLYAHWLPLFPGDLQMALYLQSFSSPLLTSIMSWTSRLFTGWSAALLVVATGLLVGWRIRKAGGLFIWTAGLVSLINGLFKILIDRPRPTSEEVQIIGANQGSSFPSGHTFFATLFLGMLAYLLFTHLKQKYLRILSLVGPFLFILMVGISRIYLGAHWPSDVIGAYVFGSLFLFLLIWLYLNTLHLHR
jgi:membrane-associated phospholipid phosphatase